MKLWNQPLSKVIACATLLLALGSCSGGGSGGGETTTPPAPASGSVTINSPAQGAPPLPPGPVLITFGIQNSPVPLSTTQPRMHFRVDSDTTVYKFYDGPGIVEEGSLSGVRYQGVHTHFVHWKSGSSIQLNALASGSHQVRFVLVDQSGIELQSTVKILDFTLLQGTGGDFSLQEVASGLNFPTAMATAPDGRIFVTELVTGNIRVVTPTATLPWQLQAVLFATLPVVVTGPEQGLLGIAVHPNFSQNGYVYVFYTELIASVPVNRVVRLTATTSGGNTVATPAPPVIIFDNIPAAKTHNSGVIQFGPDGMLYIFVGENDIPSEAQNLGTLRGKILRINPDGSIPPDNPFQNSAIYSYGHRNGFGFTFHPRTHDLWQTENGEHDCDQINLIVSGGNYGWPIAPCGGDPLYIDPIITFTPTIAPTGIVAFGEDSIYPAQYHNNLLFADFNVGQLHRIELSAVTNLMTAYGMNEGSGTTLADESGGGHTGTLVNGPAWVAGQTTYGQALSFDGLDDAVSVANLDTYNFGTADFTLEIWVKRNVLGGTQRHLFSKCAATTWVTGCKELYFNPSNQLTFGSFASTATVSSTIADTNWHHIAVTFTDATNLVNIYVDGALVTTATKALEADGAGHAVMLGNMFGSHPFTGLLDEVRIYSRVLTRAEIQADSATPITPPTQLTAFSRHTIACNCGQGGLIAVMHGLNVPGQDGYIYVTNGSYYSPNHSIFRVVLNNP